MAFLDKSGVARLWAQILLRLEKKADLDEALVKSEQTLTAGEIEQVRQNIHSAGIMTTGLTMTPYEVVETGLNTSEHTITETPLDPVVAAEGAEVYNDYVGNVSTGLYSIATGYKTQATGPYARSNGWWTRSEGQCANAEGLLSVASGHFSHAEGTRTLASQNNAHSEGDMTKATGRQSHAEGQSTTSSGFCSHAEGSGTVSSGYYSHSEGLGTIAAGKNQTAMGKYNVRDTSSLLIVGKGTSDSARSNAFRVTSGGAGYFASSVYAEDSKKLATEEYVDAAVSSLEATLEVTITDNEGTPSADKTVAEILTAHDAGFFVRAWMFGQEVIPLSYIAEDRSYVQFSQISCDADEDQFGWAYGDAVTIYSDGAVQTKTVNLVTETSLSLETNSTDVIGAINENHHGIEEVKRIVTAITLDEIDAICVTGS